jgi:hypothetical protein
MCFKPGNHYYEVMMKPLQNFSETHRNAKPSFSKFEQQPRKPQKHRYERRKIRAYLQQRDFEPLEME